jgi:molybdopterin converting factor small subunit
MARLLLFAGLREAAGQSRLEADAATVGELLDLAAKQFGDDFRRGLARSAVWVNGDPAESDHALEDGDEVAVIPPVSGGAQAVVSLGSAQSAVAMVGLAALVAGNVFGQPAFAAALVGVAAVWVIDLKREGGISGVRLAVPPILATIVAAMAGAHILGIAGLGLAAGFAVIATLAWAVLRPEYRALESIASTAVVCLVCGLAVASLYLVRARADGMELIFAFLLMVTAGALLAWAVMRFLPESRFDPFTIGTVAVLLAGVGASFIWDFGVAAMLLASVAVAAGTIAGRALGSMVRNGSVVLTERAPGTLTSYDGAVVAAALYFSVLRLVLG